MRLRSAFGARWLSQDFVELDEVTVSIPDGAEEDGNRSATGARVIDALRCFGDGDVRCASDTFESRFQILQIEYENQAAGLRLAEHGLGCRFREVESLHQAEHADEIVVRPQQDEPRRAADHLVVDDFKAEGVAIER